MPVQRKAFLQFDSDQDTWHVSADYKTVADKHVDSTPTTLYLPWPEDLIPSVGEKFVFLNMMEPNIDMVVTDIEYFYSSKEGIRIFVTIEPTGGSKKFDRFDEYNLVFAATEGWLFEDKTPIKDALEAAGLPTTRDELKTKRGER